MFNIQDQVMRIRSEVVLNEKKVHLYDNQLVYLNIQFGKSDSWCFENRWFLYYRSKIKRPPT